MNYDSNILKLEMKKDVSMMVCMLPGIFIVARFLILLAICNMRYKLQTRFMPMDMNSWKARGIKNEISIELEAELARSIICWASSFDLAWLGIFDTIV